MTNTQNLPDTGPLFLTAFDQLTEVVYRVAPGDLGLPTPCVGWTVRDLHSHLVAVEDRVAHIAQGGQAFEVPSQVDGIADDAWVAAWDDRSPRVRAAVTDDADPGRIVDHPAGRLPWAVAVGIYSSELATHTWDLARALGVDAELDQQVAAAVLGPIQDALPAQPRGEEVGIPFGPVVPVADDASSYEQLVGWLGRDPEWAAA